MPANARRSASNISIMSRNPDRYVAWHMREYKDRISDMLCPCEMIHYDIYEFVTYVVTYTLHSTLYDELKLQIKDKPFPWFLQYSVWMSHHSHECLLLKYQHSSNIFIDFIMHLVDVDNKCALILCAWCIINKIKYDSIHLMCIHHM